MTQLSNLAMSMVGSEIVRLNADIKSKIANGSEIYNYTIGDFSPQEFPIPNTLLEAIMDAYKAGKTNYPPAVGIPELRSAVKNFVNQYGQTDYTSNEVLIASGGRPLIYATFRAVVDKGDKVIYAAPSWNNNHYANMTEAEHCIINTTAENKFMPTAEDIAPHIKGATLLCLCTPQNPTGTTLEKETLDSICQMVVAENSTRGENEKKLYIMFDQMYFTLTFGSTKHYCPASVHPAVRPYVIMMDGASKAFAATGVRVGWACAPEPIIKKMSAILSHVGAWAPMAEQHALASFLENTSAVNAYFTTFKSKIEERLNYIASRMQDLKTKGYPVDAIDPEAAIYLTLKFDLVGKKFKGSTIETQETVTQFLIDEAGLAIVPFYCFGAKRDQPWYRISIGTSNIKDLTRVFDRLEVALGELQ